ncbi:MAG: preprotein translocase subunit YajC [Burkholderiales bacterium]|nr:preprotein translocase subunit YajC [Burkholderiales bacterium]
MLIGTAYAQAAGGAQEGSLLMSLAPMILIFVVFWFLLIRPQQKKMKEHRAMLTSLQTGEEVATAGGIIGRVKKIEDSVITLEIAEDIEVLIQRGTVSQLLPKGTIKTF